MESLSNLAEARSGQLGWLCGGQEGQTSGIALRKGWSYAREFLEGVEHVFDGSPIRICDVSSNLANSGTTNSAH